MEKVKIDTEVRKLDMLRTAHLNQQYEIGRQVKDLPGRIENSRECHAGLLEDIASRDAHEGKEFTMTVDGREFSGKNAREEAGMALIQVIMASLWEDSKELKLKRLGDYKGFAIMSSFSSPLVSPFAPNKCNKTPPMPCVCTAQIIQHRKKIIAIANVIFKSAFTPRSRGFVT